MITFRHQFEQTSLLYPSQQQADDSRIHVEEEREAFAALPSHLSPDFQGAFCQDLLQVSTPLAPPIPTIPRSEELIRELMRRFVRETADGSEQVVYRSTEEQKLFDTQRLIHILDWNNRIFRSNIDLVHSEMHEGICEERLEEENTLLCVRADLHGDHTSLLALLTLLQEKGFLDANFRCRGDFRMIFLGDFLDRGEGDIEVLSLLLTLRMENPTSVILIRGNHECIAMNKQYTLLNPQFFEQNQQQLIDCYKSFPVALCIACKTARVKADGSHERQYVHFSHALFSVAFPIGSSLRGDNSCTVIPKNSVFDPTRYATTEKVRAAGHVLFEKFAAQPNSLQSDCYLWSDIGTAPRPSPRGLGYVLSPEDIHLYFRLNATQRSKICHLMQGHTHRFLQHTIARREDKGFGPTKCIATTLPVAIGSGAYTEEFSNELLQGFIVTVRPKVGDWRKRAIVIRDASMNPVQFVLSPETKGLYELC